MKTDASILTPMLTDEERKHLEDAYRQAIGTVRALARALGKPCPIVSREERREATRRILETGAILDIDNL